MISLCTTYKNRPNYTIITLATMREALHMFNEKINFFFYDDASTIPPPVIVEEFGNDPKVAKYIRHRNEKGLGAEYGNIDAITKCFKLFPETTHVLVLDNDLCVHPYALYAMRRMIRELPTLGFGAIFNSELFVEEKRVGDNYVIKPVNPGLGGVIAKDAWMWHLEQDKKLKGKSKNPAQPGWDWTFSAWMKDCGGRWDVHATYQSYVEHIGCIGTNVSANFMFRGRRYLEHVDESLKAYAQPVDILLLVKDLDTGALERMRLCLASLSTNGNCYRLCISDASKEPIKDVLKKHISIPFEYCWEPCDGLFNRSRVINNGVRNLVKSNLFMVMDIDIVVPSNYISKMLYYYNEVNTFVIGRMAYLKEGHPLSSDWRVYLNHEITLYYNCGFFMCSLPLFKEINGFDEDYIGWGAEDDDFNLRMVIKTKGKIRKLEGMEMTCFHLYHQKREPKEQKACDSNRKRYWANKLNYESGKLPVEAILGLIDKRGKK